MFLNKILFVCLKFSIIEGNTGLSVFLYFISMDANFILVNLFYKM